MEVGNSRRFCSSTYFANLVILYVHACVRSRAHVCLCVRYVSLLLHFMFLRRLFYLSFLLQYQIMIKEVSDSIEVTISLYFHTIATVYRINLTFVYLLRKYNLVVCRICIHLYKSVSEFCYATS
jgi:hypothetical protein